MTSGGPILAVDVVVVLESMKMEMPVESENAGTVTQICCVEGQAVQDVGVEGVFFTDAGSGQFSGLFVEGQRPGAVPHQEVSQGQVLQVCQVGGVLLAPQRSAEIAGLLHQKRRLREVLPEQPGRGPW